MALSQVITFGGSPDQLVWKYGDENITTTSQLIVEATHEALLVVNGEAADLFGPGTRTLSLPNIPIVNKITRIPTGGVNPFPCKVFYVNKVHQMNMLWGTLTPIALDDPEFSIFLHVGLHGSISFSVSDTRKFLLKLVGFRNDFSSESLVHSFRNIISKHVKDTISKIMIYQKVGYFSLEPHLMDIGEVVKARLDTIFEDYGLTIHFFDIEGVDVPKEDYDQVSAAKERRAGRIIEGYDWNEEKKMEILKAFAENQGAMGTMGGVMGGMMGGVAMGGALTDLTRSALDGSYTPGSPPPKNVADAERNAKMQYQNNQQSYSGTNIGAGNPGGFGGFDVDTNFGAVGAPGFGGPVAPPPIPNVSYFVAMNGQAAGPFDAAALTNMLASGQINKDSLVWKQGMVNWAKIDTVDELKFLFAPPVPPIPPIPNMPPMPPMM